MGICAASCESKIAVTHENYCALTKNICWSDKTIDAMQRNELEWAVVYKRTQRRECARVCKVTPKGKGGP